MRSLRSNSATWWPALFSSAAAASPAGPDPMTATRRPVRKVGGSGRTQPSSNARSMIDCSSCLSVAGSSRGITCPRSRCRGILVLSGFADVAGLLVAVALGHVRAGLAGSNRTRAVAVAVLGDHSGHPCLHRLTLGALAQGALVVHRHDLH